MNVPQTTPRFWAGLSLREALAAAFSAALIVVSEIFFRVPLHLPGHRVLPLVFFLLLGRRSVSSGWAGTAIGLIAGLILFSLGRETPAHIPQYVIIGLVADLISLVLGRFHSAVVGLIAGALLGACWLPVQLLVNRMLGMDAGLAVAAALIRNGWAIAFGAIGGLLAFSVGNRLRAVGLPAYRSAGARGGSKRPRRSATEESARLPDW